MNETLEIAVRILQGKPDIIFVNEEIQKQAISDAIKFAKLLIKTYYNE